MEDLGNLRVHRDHVVALYGNLLVPLVHLVVDPVLELLAHDGVDHVRKVGPAQLGDLLAGRQCSFHISVVLGELEDVLDGQPLELRDVDDLHVVAVDDALHAHGQVSQVPDGDGLVGGQVRAHL